MIDDDWKKKYQLASGEEVEIIFNDDGLKIIVQKTDGRKIGHFDFDCDGCSYYITHMFLNELSSEYVGKGIGRACLQFHKELFNSIITCADNDGNQRDDGSQLTGCAPGFVLKMQQEGIIEQNNYDYCEY